METTHAYFDRKHKEISFLNACLHRPIQLAPANTVTAIVGQKFQLAAALKSQQTLDHWAYTETAWAEQKEFRSGSFLFHYEYQRAGLSVSGPPVYEALASIPTDYFQRTLYTCSGMAAISALLAAIEQLNKPMEIAAFPGTYSETLELIENHHRNLRLQWFLNWRQTNSRPFHYRALWVDCCIGSIEFKEVLNSSANLFDIILFDTTGLWSGSGRIRRVLNWAIEADVPVILLRSHTKLDSLGVEYGRLGSLVFIGAPEWELAEGASLEYVSNQAADALRLFGTAAVPAHFPPFVGNGNYAALNARRIAAMLNNSRGLRKTLKNIIPNAERNFVHGLYVALMPDRTLAEHQAKDLAHSMCRDLLALGLPVHHAGSFGFDFAAAEWFRDSLHDRHLVRVAVPDLPTELWDHLVDEIIRWWKNNAGSLSSHALASRNLYHRRRAHSRIWHMSAKTMI
jgi:hypothetical protein